MIEEIEDGLLNNIKNDSVLNERLYCHYWQTFLGSMRKIQRN